jgi:hypothetical protein
MSFTKIIQGGKCVHASRLPGMNNAEWLKVGKELEKGFAQEMR